MSTSEATAERVAYKEHLESDLKAVDEYTPSADMLGGQWSKMVWPGSPEALACKNPETGVPLEELRRIGMVSVQTPPDFVSVTSVQLPFSNSNYVVSPPRKYTPVSSDTFPLAPIASSRVKE